MVSLQGAFGSTQHRFNGTVELDRVSDPELSGFASAAMPFRCVLSKSKAVKPFLDAQSRLDKQRLAEATESSRKYVETQNKRSE